MKTFIKLTLIVLAVGLALSFAHTDALAQNCCRNQTPANGVGAGDDFVSGPLPTPGCTNEPGPWPCWRFDNLQELLVGAICGGADPDGAGPATGTTCSGTPTTVHREIPPGIPALSGWGVLLFVLLASGLVFARRRRSRTLSI